jgi:hypothetical protein
MGLIKGLINNPRTKIKTNLKLLKMNSEVNLIVNFQFLGIIRDCDCLIRSSQYKFGKIPTKNKFLLD